MPRPTCARCGYDLTGIGDGQRWATCPECGHIFDSTHPYPRPWPHPARLTLLLVGPSTLLLAGVAFVVLLERARLAEGEYKPISVILLIGAFVVPMVVSRHLAVTHGVRYERRLLWLVLSVVSVVYALMLGLVIVVFVAR